MATRRRFGKKLVRLLVPIVLVLAVALLVALVSIVYGITRPPRRSYLVTPETFSTLSGTGKALKVTEETWTNRDHTAARGWLLRGVEGAPAVIFLHRYGGDRSLLLNLGMKVNEATGCTILWPDLRAHGLNPSVQWTSFGTREGDDVLAAIDFLRSLKGADKHSSLIADRLGIYGVELGAYAALRAASADSGIQVLALDSVPADQDELVDAAVDGDVRVKTHALNYLARQATKFYFFRQYDNKRSCDLARALGPRRVMLLAGEDGRLLRESTKALAPCFADPTRVETRTDSALSGLTLPSATGQEGESYDRPVIDFFVKNLR